jgi:hypothetical protein
MKHFAIEQSDEEFYTSHSDISLVGLALNRFTSLPIGLEKVVPSNNSISHADAIKSYWGMPLCGSSGLPTKNKPQEDSP